MTKIDACVSDVNNVEWILIAIYNNLKISSRDMIGS